MRTPSLVTKELMNWSPCLHLRYDSACTLLTGGFLPPSRRRAIGFRADHGLRLLVALHHGAVIGRNHRVKLGELGGIGTVPGAVHLANDGIGAGRDHASLREACEGRSRCHLAWV